MVLREADLVQDRCYGWNIFYQMIRPKIFEVMDAASELLGEGNKVIIGKATFETDYCIKPIGRYLLALILSGNLHPYQFMHIRRRK